MSRKIALGATGLVLVLMVTATVEAAPLFVATAQNFRGALYLGYGPSPCAATEAAVAKCSQDSFFTRSCKVVGVRMECPPPPPMPAMYPPIQKAKPKVSQPYGPPPPYKCGRPMQ